MSTAPDGAIVLRFPIQRIIGKQRIGGSLLEPASGFREMRARVVVVTQGQRRPRAYGGALFASGKLRQTFISDAHGMIVQIAREPLELLLRRSASATGGLASGLIFFLAAGFFGVLVCCGAAMLENRETAAEHARQEHRHRIA